jgi:2-polyprenyl-3-methyl-5-hydroxy-6-metoxy-1,4-benzoquinol methylase
MGEKILSFYSSLADYYHLIFEDWDASIAHQASVLDALISTRISGHPLKILDCACGIGTQALGFASFGHHVTGSDLSPSAIARAKREAEHRRLHIEYRVADMTTLEGIDPGFDVVAALDNALPHLSAEQLACALSSIASRLRQNGLFLASIRDYDALILTKPTVQPPAFYGQAGNRRFVHQVWDWIDEKSYALHHFITVQEGSAWTAHHFVSEYHCLLRDELSAALHTTGFDRIQWLVPAESGYYQPIVVARKT